MAESFQPLDLVSSSRSPLRVLFAGDSIMEGVANSGGVREGVMAAFNALGVDFDCVGPRTAATNNSTYGHNAMASDLAHNAKGGLTSSVFLAGEGGGDPFLPWSTVVANYPADVCILCLGTNDGSNPMTNRTTAKQVCETWGATAARPLVWLTPAHSVSTSARHAPADTSRILKSNEIILAARESGANVGIVEGSKTIGGFYFDPAATGTDAQCVRSAGFVDGTHFNVEGCGVLGGAIVARLFGLPNEEVWSRMERVGRYAPSTASYHGSNLSAGTVTIAAPRSRRAQVESLVVTNRSTANAVNLSLSIQPVAINGSNVGSAVNIGAATIPANGSSPSITIPKTDWLVDLKLTIAGTSPSVDVAAQIRMMWR